jgi:glutamyl-tRNA reductase
VDERDRAGAGAVIVLVGVSHRTAPLEVREALAFPKERMGEALQRLRDEAGLEEAMILSTCNRVELYGRARDAMAEGDPPAPDAAARIESFLARFHGRAPGELGDAVYRMSGQEAIRHAFRVAASLESMVVGEPQILGQVKEAYHAAEAAGTLGATLNALRNRSLAAAKRARTETGIGHNAVSIAHVAVELARKIFGDLRDKNVLLVGAGKMSELAARTLVRTGARATVLGGRTFEKATALAAALGGRAVPLESLRAELAAADIVISGTGAPGLVIHEDDVVAARRARKGRQHRPLFLIDIAVPRDIEAKVAKLGGVFLYDLDDLRAVAEANMRERMKEAAAAEALVDREVHQFLDWFKARDAVPLLLALRQRAEDIRRLELEKARKRMGPLTPEQEDALDAATTAIVNKLLHSPIVHLKESAQNGHGPEHVSLIRKLLGL